jgi:hypothetical protein
MNGGGDSNERAAAPTAAGPDAERASGEPRPSGLKRRDLMDAFESLVATLLEREGFWVRSSFKVELTPAEKRRIERPSSPRWELDLVAYRGSTNEIRIIECKSYLFSRGVSTRAFTAGDRFATRFKLFNDKALYRVVRERLVHQLVASGACRPRPHVNLGLAAGRITSSREHIALQRLFRRKGWLLLDDEWLRAGLAEAAGGGYENDVASVVAKLLERGGVL